MTEYEPNDLPPLRENNPRTLRDIVGYWNEFDVVLSAPFRDRTRDTSMFEDRFPFYERIGAVVSDLGKSVFLPHRDLDCSQPIERQYAQLYDIIIPSSKLEIAYFSISPHFESLQLYENEGEIKNSSQPITIRT